MQHGVYAHPWDLDDDEVFAELEALGFAGVSLATAYHAGRWLTPSAPLGLVRFLEDGVVHFRPRREDYGTLAPLPSSEVPARGPSPLERAIETAAERGLGVHAWTVLFHNSRLGRAFPDACVHNAVGDAYTYALCPARPEVADYGRALVADVARHEGLAAIELEAAGFFGYRHGSHHDKCSFVLDAELDFLLSYCFCESCVDGLRRLGLDGDGVRERVAARLRERVSEGDAMHSVEADGDLRPRLARLLGEAEVEGLLAHRREVYRSILKELRAAAQGVPLHVHARFDRCFTGSQMGEERAVLEEFVDGLVVTHYGEPLERIEAAWAAEAAVGEGRAWLAIWPRAPWFRDDTAVERVLRLAAQQRCAGLRVYHLGLLSQRTLRRVAAVLAAGRGS